MTDEDKLKFDTVYSKNISFAMDVKIVALTIVNVLRKTGINSNYTE
ncbi:sugar transferase [Weissella confusa]|nr:sugar transferase [Weissella confusa]